MPQKIAKKETNSQGKKGSRRKKRTKTVIKFKVKVGKVGLFGIKCVS